MDPQNVNLTILKLRDIEENIDHIEQITTPITYEIFRQDWRTYSAVERGLERISEASRSIPPHLKALYLDIPWPQIAGIGNILRHNYERVSLKIIWDTTQTSLSELRKVVTALLHDLAADDLRHE